MKIFVTGGAGFIGSHFATRLMSTIASRSRTTLAQIIRDVVDDQRQPLVRS